MLVASSTLQLIYLDERALFKITEQFAQFASASVFCNIVLAAHCRAQLPELRIVVEQLPRPATCVLQAVKLPVDNMQQDKLVIDHRFDEIVGLAYLRVVIDIQGLSRLVRIVEADARAGSRALP